MNRMGKRCLALLLALAISLGMLSGLELTATAVTVEYTTGSTTLYSSYENVILNWGQRGTIATFLSPNAEAFYVDNDVTYSSLSQLSGADTLSDVPQSELYLALQTLMTENHHTITTYAQIRDLCAFTDCQNSDPSAISCFYSGKSIGPDWDGGATWNREHTWPNSKGLDGDDENDIMMLRPTDSSTNSSRGNKAYGESSGYYDPNGASDGTLDVRGDVARIMLYVYVRWGNTGKMWGSSGVIESLEVLLKWMEEDPVDTWELARNDSVESITGTRNVFVDYPELAYLLFDEEVPAELTTPSGEAASKSGYTVTAQCGDGEMGEVSVSGHTIVAYPADGYSVTGYSVTEGTAVVTQSGNVFTVETQSDCTVCILFAPKTSAELTFLEDGTVGTVAVAYVGDTIQLPGYSGTLPDGYTFAGWVTEQVSKTEDRPQTVYSAGESYTVSGSLTMYALLSGVDASESNGSVYQLYTGVPEEGDYLIVYATAEDDVGAMQASVSKNRLTYANVTVDNNTVTDPDASLVWHISQTTDGYYTLYNARTGTYAGGTGTKSQAALLSSVTSYAKWSVSGTETYTFVNLGNYDKGVNYTLFRNGTYGFACYAAGFASPLSLYRCADGTVYYTTSTALFPESITSDSCTVTDSGIFYILPGTTVAELTGELKEGEYVRVFDGETELTAEDILTFGAAAKLMDGDEVVQELDIYFMGDVNRDRSVNPEDAALLLQHLASWNVALDQTAGDVNGDGGLDPTDAALLLQYLAGWSVTFAVGTAE